MNLVSILYTIISITKQVEENCCVMTGIEGSSVVIHIIITGYTK